MWLHHELRKSEAEAMESEHLKRKSCMEALHQGILSAAEEPYKLAGLLHQEKETGAERRRLDAVEARSQLVDSMRHCMIDKMSNAVKKSQDFMAHGLDGSDDAYQRSLAQIEARTRPNKPELIIEDGLRSRRAYIHINYKKTRQDIVQKFGVLLIESLTDRVDDMIISFREGLDIMQQQDEQMHRKRVAEIAHQFSEKVVTAKRITATAMRQGFGSPGPMPSTPHRAP
jgi:hypothetical protein